ncbi:MAG: hypothetical protein H8E34_05210 [Bacteroidetes bacterium]|nr:hypothetical protein [Bacteroidota bacterium]
MKRQDINILIEKFYQGKSTPEEDKILKDVLRNNTDEEFAAVRSQFQIMNNIYSVNDSLNESFDEKILQNISTSKPAKTKLFNMQRILSGIAATVLILISIWVVSGILSTKEVYGTINDPHAAFAETKKALQKVSGNVNKGVKPATTNIKKAESGLDKTKKVKNLNKLNNTGLLLKSMTKVKVNYGKS